MVEVLSQDCAWVFILTKESTKKFIDRGRSWRWRYICVG